MRIIPSSFFVIHLTETIFRVSFSLFLYFFVTTLLCHIYQNFLIFYLCNSTYLKLHPNASDSLFEQFFNTCIADQIFFSDFFYMIVFHISFDNVAPSPTQKLPIIPFLNWHIPFKLEKSTFPKMGISWIDQYCSYQEKNVLFIYHLNCSVICPKMIYLTLPMFFPHFLIDQVLFLRLKLLYQTTKFVNHSSILMSCTH